MLVSSAKLPSFVTVIPCKQEFLILGLFFPCLVGPFTYLLLAVNTSLSGDELSSFCFLPVSPLSSLWFSPPVWTQGPLATSGPSMCRCCAGLLLLLEAVLFYCSVSFYSDVYINNWMPLVGCSYTPGSYIHQFSAFFFFCPLRSQEAAVGISAALLINAVTPPPVAPEQVFLNSAAFSICNTLSLYYVYIL